MLYMKGTPMFPQCGFSARVVQILTHLGVPFQTANVLEDTELREGVKQFSNWPTIPQLYVKGEFVGGCDIVTEMFQSGELRRCSPRRASRTKRGLNAERRPTPPLAPPSRGGGRTTGQWSAPEAFATCVAMASISGGDRQS